LRCFGRSVVVLLSLLYSAAPAPARAIEPDAAAVQQLVEGQEAARRALRAALAAASADAIAQIQTIEATLAASADGTAAANALFDALEALQVEIDAALLAAGNAQGDAAKGALATLGTGLGGIYPRGFYAGDATPSALFEEAYTKEVARAYAKLHKRLKKTAARFQEAGFGLTFRLSPPRSFPFRVWSEEFVDSVLIGVAKLDVVLAWSDLSVLGDGRLRAAGSAGEAEQVGLGEVTITAVLGGGTPTLDVTADPADGRFSSDFGGQVFPEGSWLLIVTQQSLVGPDVSIGIR
jgi:hypothetical protein